ncbi:MAG TPA: Fe-S protein assembly co-chaperone HscB [Armatimonadota bacterium]|jgi:molecular chaperone HscB
MRELEPIPAGTDFYTVLGVPKRLDLDARALEESFYALSRRYHPDRFATAEPKARITSLEASAQINRAYKTLKSPWDRARYLVEMEGGSPAAAQPPQDLFEEILDLMESLGDLRQAIIEGEASEELGAHVHSIAKPFRDAYAATETRLQTLSQEWDGLADGDTAGRRAVVDRLAALLGERRYLQRVNEDVDAAFLGKPPSREH